MPHSLQLGWADVPGATGYTVRVTSATGPPLALQSQHSHLLVSNLFPNRLYRASVRAESHEGASGWSADLVTCTRPPVPPSPNIRNLSMLQLEFQLEWNLKAVVEGLDDADQIEVVLRRTGLAGAETSWGGLPLEGRRLEAGANSAGYDLRLTCPRAEAPAGWNLSAWCPRATNIPEVFGGLRLPGTGSAGVIARSWLIGQGS
mgnify:CR=1 FL=1